MATKTNMLGLNKAEPKDLVKVTLTTSFNENWDKIDSAIGEHVSSSTVHVTKDGSLQVGLNAEMVGGLRAEQLAAAEHNHDDRYYTRAEVDALIAAGQGPEPRPVYSIRPSLSDAALLFAGPDRIVTALSGVLDRGDTIYGGLKIVMASELNMTFTPLYKNETDDSVRLVFVFSFDDTSGLSSASQVAVRFSESDAVDCYKVTYSPQTGNIVLERVSGTSEVVDSAVVSPAVARTIRTAVDEMTNVFPSFGPAYCVDVTYGSSTAVVCVKTITDIRFAYDTKNGNGVSVLYRKDITFPEPRLLGQFHQCGLHMLGMSDTVLHLLDITTYSKHWRAGV